MNKTSNADLWAALTQVQRHGWLRRTKMSEDQIAIHSQKDWLGLPLKVIAVLGEVAGANSK